MNRIRSLIISAAICQCGAVNAEVLRFTDASSFENFSITFESSVGSGLLKQTEGDYELRLKPDWQGERIEFSIEFDVPHAEGSENFFVQSAQPLVVNVEVQVTERLLQEGGTIPVFYFDEIGQAGFRQIDPHLYEKSDKVFEQYFKAAQFFDHYYLRLNTYNHPYVRRSLKLWRDASFHLAAHEFDWWKISQEIEFASARTFTGSRSTTHEATLKYIRDTES